MSLVWLALLWQSHLKSDTLSIWLRVFFFGSRREKFLCELNWVMNIDSLLRLRNQTDYLLFHSIGAESYGNRCQTHNRLRLMVDLGRERTNELTRFTTLRWLMDSRAQKREKNALNLQQTTISVVFMRKSIVRRTKPTRLRMIKHGVYWCTDAFPSWFYSPRQRAIYAIINRLLGFSSVDINGGTLLVRLTMIV